MYTFDLYSYVHMPCTIVKEHSETNVESQQAMSIYGGLLTSMHAKLIHTTTHDDDMHDDSLYTKQAYECENIHNRQWGHIYSTPKGEAHTP
jgi:hypothetical protein